VKSSPASESKSGLVEALHELEVMVARMAAAMEANERFAREQATSLEQSKRIFEHASAVAKIGVWECDLNFEALTWTDGVYDLFELPRGSAVTREQILELYSERSRKELEVLRAKAIREQSGFELDAEIITAKGNKRWMRLTANVEYENGVPARIFGMKQDITAEKALWERTRFLAEVDVLTGLANRSAFQIKLSGATGAEPVSGGALLLIDLDGFKHVNDTFGHALGDECLKEIAVRLRSVSEQAQILARIGGDEFAVLIGGDLDHRSIEQLADQILEELRRPMYRGEQSFQLGASIGIAPRETAASPSDLLANADIALYAAKAAGKNSYKTFTGDMKIQVDRRAATVARIADALSEDRLELYYQPKINIGDNSLAGFEALLRVRVPDGSVIAAGAFAAAFEDPELSRRLDQWVIDSALAQASRWTRTGVGFGHIAINLSSSQLHDPRFAERLLEKTAMYGLSPQLIEVEMTEGVFLRNEIGPVSGNLGRLKDNGIRIALDDFGTGYASLVHLRSYPIDIIKIDKSFVDRFLSSEQDRAIMEATVGLGLRLGMDVVAEGIETSGQLEGLKELGCPIGQGFLFSAPIPASAAANWQMPSAVRRAPRM
jgi:diguanylate cyclase (GGDEF)-like protein